MDGLKSPCLVALVFATLFTKGLPSPLQGTETWGYVTVRDGAHMFWWLYYADSPSAEYRDLPLVMWLQGGPGGSGTGFGNFAEIGPLDGDLKPRDTTWVQSASVLFVDNPVGTGFSYTDEEDAYATNVSTVALDMLVLLKNFFNSLEEFESIPFYIFSESYGGKMASAISLELTKAIAQGSIKCNFAGVALGDSWISPLDSVMTWGPYLYTTSLLDDPGLAEVTDVAQQVKDAVGSGHFLKATELWSLAESVVEKNTNNVNFYNILTQDTDEKVTARSGEDFISLQFRRHVNRLHKQSLSELMNGPIRKKLGVIPQNVTWGGQSEGVFRNMAGDFMRPVIDLVDQLLSAGVNVTVYNGQLDLIVDTMGQELWVNMLKWEGLSYFNKMRWTPLDDPSSPGVTGAFYKNYKNFSFYWILKAGHMIPSDQGPMALRMLQMITQQTS
ncbi:retinoid-inducible serine carboxypeptidase isoform X2 [Periophthalmus magnuspinnatus]|uniref:retinoid-inducible serine carboxypeptidase isoform X2 n=1 Tax=Periophthalmus magnuspinnatus TaxID=409849 RepID=UPI00145A654F|nr:retinoid-inducible serine carboxypeptidase isoform X2 [Periophthalmus magnuspinnatus]